MSHSLDVPEDDESLYLIVGETVDDTRPVNQGDVFRGITLPGFPEDDHRLIILTTHPCSLRAGPRLRPRLQASPVHRSRYLPPEQWAHSYLRQMPLPALVDDEHHMVTLTEAGIVTPEQLVAAERIGALSEAGILLLQQRLVWALAHAVVGRDTLADYSGSSLLGVGSADVEFAGGEVDHGDVVAGGAVAAGAAFGGLDEGVQPFQEAV